MERYRAIIIKDGKIALMERHKQGRHFFAFPGGGRERGETPSQCCEREVLEEFGIKVKAKNMIYEIYQNGTKQGFFVCDWLEGEIHKTGAEEYTQKDVNVSGTYEPGLFDLSEIENLPVKPQEILEELLKDLKQNKNLDFETKVIQVENM